LRENLLLTIDKEVEMQTSVYHSIEKKRKKLKEKRKELEETQLTALRELIPNHAIKTICERCRYFFRERFLTPIIIIFHMIGAAISREGSFQSAWHNSGQAGKSGSLAKARNRLPLNVWRELDRWIVVHLQEEFDKKDRWHGYRLVGVDGSCVSMSDGKELERAFGKTNSKHGRSRFPVGRVAFAFTLNSLVTISHTFDRYKVSEQTLFLQLIEQLQQGDLIIGDGHLAGANLYAQYLRKGMAFLTRAHQCLHVEQLSVVKRVSKDDLLVKMPVLKIHRRENPLMPEYIVVRMIKITTTVRGKKETFWLATSLVDTKRYSAHEIKALYKRRWKVETLIEEIKIWLSADVLRSKTVSGIHKEMFARIIAGNLVHWLMLKAAKKCRKDVNRLSTSAALRLTACYSIKMSTAPAWRLVALYEDLLDAISNSEVPYRPERIEPRMKRRDQKHYPTLKISRKEWRRINGIAA
jgi:hypothetical protein